MPPSGGSVFRTQCVVISGFALLASACAGCGLFGSLPAERSSILTVKNHSAVAICAVYLGEGQRRGPNWLRGRETIAPDEARAFTVAAGTYGLRLDDCEGRVLYAHQAFRIRGTMRFEFRAIEVERRQRVGTRRFARTRDRTHQSL